MVRLDIWFYRYVIPNGTGWCNCISFFYRYVVPNGTEFYLFDFHNSNPCPTELHMFVVVGADAGHGAEVLAD
jgi:hypothetical protein